jgi:hypothetical protein
MKVGLLSASEVSISLAIETSEKKEVLSNDELLSFCKEGPLLELFSKEISSFDDLKREFVSNKVSTSVILIEDQLPTFSWNVQSKKIVLEVFSDPPETAVFVVRLRESP